MTRFQKIIIGLSFITNSAGYAAFLDGHGYYGARGLTRINESFSNYAGGTHQTIEQTARLNFEFRASDKTSFFVDFSVFGDPFKTYMGDVGVAQHCVVNDQGRPGSGSDCAGQPQSSWAPGYEPIVPYITAAYVQYAHDFCMIQAGRRPRHWGLGAYLNAGKDPFDRSRTVFDGISCDFNTQDNQTLGFSFGYDKLAETGRVHAISPTSGFGIASDVDDLDQFFVTLDYDDRKSGNNAGFGRRVGIYFANVISRKGGGHLGDHFTDVKFADFFAGFYLQSLSWENEFVLRQGSTTDPSYVQLGGLASTPSADELSSQLYRQVVDSIGVVGKVNFTLSQSGSLQGPAEYGQGNLESHNLFLEYAYAPGDADGYLPHGPDGGRNLAVTGMAFHENFRPALYLLGDRNPRQSLATNGVYAHNRLLNTLELGAGYRYESMRNGNIELKWISMFLNESMPAAVKDQQASFTAPEQERSIGYAGSTLGHELDVKYNHNLAKDLKIGAAVGYAISGAAMDTIPTIAPDAGIHLETSLAVTF